MTTSRRPGRPRGRVHSVLSTAARLGNLLVLGWTPTAAAEDHGVGGEPVVWRIGYDNDYFMADDDQLSAGWSIQRHSPAADNWEAVLAPRWLTRVGEYFPTLDAADHRRRLGVGIGQLIQTPSDLTDPQPIDDDVPYVGILCMFASWTAVRVDHLVGLQFFVGITGEPSLGEQIQAWSHDLVDDESPQGWDNQLGFEPLVNIDYGQWWKLLDSGGERFAIDLDGGASAALGNLRTVLEIRLQARCGWNLPAGFAPVPAPGGIGIAQLPRLGAPEGLAFFLTASGHMRAVAYDIFLDGSLFDSSEPQAPDRDPIVLEAILGAHLVHRDFALRMQWVFSSDPVDIPRSSRSYGALTFEWSL